MNCQSEIRQHWDSVNATTIDNEQATLLPGAHDARVRGGSEQVVIILGKVIANKILANVAMLIEKYQYKRCGRHGP